jgi:hypothetical protein
MKINYKRIAQNFMDKLKHPYDKDLFYRIFSVYVTGGATHYITVKRGIFFDRIYRASSLRDLEHKEIDKSDIRKAVAKGFLIAEKVSIKGGITNSYAFPWLPGPQASLWKKTWFSLWEMVKYKLKGDTQ